jgi:hypothetical protein
MVTMVTVMPAVVIPIATTDSKDAIDRAHRAADTGADRATNDRAHRACRAATLTHALIGAALHAADDALCMTGMGHRQQRENECRGCKRQLDAQAGCRRRYDRLHCVHPVHLDQFLRLGRYGFRTRGTCNADVAKRLRDLGNPKRVARDGLRKSVSTPD